MGIFPKAKKISPLGPKISPKWGNFPKYGNTAFNLKTVTLLMNYPLTIFSHVEREKCKYSFPSSYADYVFKMPHEITYHGK
jgi:hypothetical protein